MFFFHAGGTKGRGREGEGTGAAGEGRREGTSFCNLDKKLICYAIVWQCGHIGGRISNVRTYCPTIFRYPYFVQMFLLSTFEVGWELLLQT